ncbi:cytochrome-c peroxidase [Desulfatitalea tepidiphila]|uniref:cytochrome-c peroxidase n=1 Tax=Desulfatitalea tepidiphila TaxID=1185843 RepID=UPI0006B525D9|nr:cytochrome c peroxidase [Desulfatitalea tepidiphila]
MKKSFKVGCLSILLITSGAFLLHAAGKPTVANDLEKLGMHLYKDKNLSLNQNQSCQTCHHPLAGFADRSNFLHPYDKVVSLGSDGVSLGGRNAPTSAYACFSPIRYQDETTGEWFGGMFWDGRATGETLGDPLAEQAQGPPLNPVEMAMPSIDAIMTVIEASTYYPLWKKVYGPITDQEVAWVNFADAVAAYERSADVTKFNSKFDVAPGQFTGAENRGYVLFQTNCASCHSATPMYAAPEALFTTYGYANIGVPANTAVPSPDLGLGGELGDTSQNGKFKIPTLRNIAVTAPYSHNGGFPTLYDMVSFINDRSGFGAPDVSENVVDGTVIGDLGLSEEDIADLIAFLNTLTDDY